MGEVSKEGAAPIFGAWYLWDERDSEASCEIWGEQTTFSFFSSFFWLSWVEIEGWFFFFFHHYDHCNVLGGGGREL